MTARSEYSKSYYCGQVDGEKGNPGIYMYRAEAAAGVGAGDGLIECNR